MPEKLLQVSYGIQQSILDQIAAIASSVKSGVLFLDKDGKIQTGTLSLSGNAGTGDVKSGKTFYSNSWTKQTGTLSLSGNAGTGNVQSGKTFYSNSFTKQTGTLTLSGNASTSQVLSGRTFYSNSWTRQTGTMTNRGAVSKSLNPGSSYTIPAGYHNGSGKVTANKTTPNVFAVGAYWWSSIASPHAGVTIYNGSHFRANTDHNTYAEGFAVTSGYYCVWYADTPGNPFFYHVNAGYSFGVRNANSGQGGSILVTRIEF